MLLVQTAALVTLALGASALGSARLLPDEVAVTVRGVGGPAQTYVADLGESSQVNAGTVDAAGHKRPHSGSYVRWRAGGGGFLVWTLNATVTHAGRTARIEIERVEVGDARELRYALGMRNNWANRDMGRRLPIAGSAVLHPSLANGEDVVFQVALPIAANESAGDFNFGLRYVGKLNGSARMGPAVRPLLPLIEPGRPRVVFPGALDLRGKR